MYTHIDTPSYVTDPTLGIVSPSAWGKGILRASASKPNWMYPGIASSVSPDSEAVNVSTPFATTAESCRLCSAQTFCEAACTYARPSPSIAIFIDLLAGIGAFLIRLSLSRAIPIFVLIQIFASRSSKSFNPTVPYKGLRGLGRSKAFLSSTNVVPSFVPGLAPTPRQRQTAAPSQSIVQKLPLRSNLPTSEVTASLRR